MSFGRAQKPLVFDALIILFPDSALAFSNLVTNQGKARFHEALHLMEKNCGVKSTLESVRKSLLSSIFFSAAGETVLLAGFWAQYFIPELKRCFPKIRFELISEKEDARHVAELT
jgi:hypothetical protein